MRSLKIVASLVLISIILFSCDKKTMPIDLGIEPEPCLNEKFKKESMPNSVNDSFYFMGLISGDQWKPTHYAFRLGGDGHDINNPFSYYFNVGEEMPFCSHVMTGVGRIRTNRNNPTDTVFLNNGNPTFRTGSIYIRRYEVKNNVLWDEQWGAKEDSLSRNNYVVIRNYSGPRLFTQKMSILSDTSAFFSSIALLLTQKIASSDLKCPYFYDLNAES